MRKNIPQAASKPGSVFDRIKPVQFGEEDPIQVLLYGRSGTGKTTLWGTFPAPILAVICSGGTNPGELRSVATEENATRIMTVSLEKSTELVDVMDAVKAGALTALDGQQFNTLVLDHASGLQDLVLAEILGLRELPAQKSFGFARREHYGQCTLQCKELIRSMLGLPCNVVIVAQERNFNDGNEESSDAIGPSVGAGLTPSLAGWLNSAVDYICQTFIRQRTTIQQTKVNGQVRSSRVPVKGEVDFCLRTAPDPTYITKFRMPKGAILPNVIDDPDYEKILAVVRGQYAAQE